MTIGRCPAGMAAVRPGTSCGSCWPSASRVITQSACPAAAGSGEQRGALAAVHRMPQQPHPRLASMPSQPPSVEPSSTTQTGQPRAAAARTTSRAVRPWLYTGTTTANRSRGPSFGLRLRRGSSCLPAAYFCVRLSIHFVARLVSARNTVRERAWEERVSFAASCSSQVLSGGLKASGGRPWPRCPVPCGRRMSARGAATGSRRAAAARAPEGGNLRDPRAVVGVLQQDQRRRAGASAASSRRRAKAN